jgi:hypothetical protein
MWRLSCGTWPRSGGPGTAGTAQATVPVTACSAKAGASTAGTRGPRGSSGGGRCSPAGGGTGCSGATDVHGWTWFSRTGAADCGRSADARHRPGPVDREQHIPVGLDARARATVGADLVADLPVVGGELACQRSQHGRVGQVIAAACCRGCRAPRTRACPGRWGSDALLAFRVPGVRPHLAAIEQVDIGAQLVQLAVVGGVAGHDGESDRSAG